jgi:hypothetical protein
LLLSALVVCLSWLFSLSLLATVRGGTGGFNWSMQHLCSNTEIGG